MVRKSNLVSTKTDVAVRTTIRFHGNYRDPACSTSKPIALTRRPARKTKQQTGKKNVRNKEEQTA